MSAVWHCNGEAVSSSVDRLGKACTTAAVDMCFLGYLLQSHRFDYGEESLSWTPRQPEQTVGARASLKRRAVYNRKDSNG